MYVPGEKVNRFLIERPLKEVSKTTVCCFLRADILSPELRTVQARSKETRSPSKETKPTTRF